PTDGTQVGNLNTKFGGTTYYSESGGTFTVDLYQMYKDQYGLSNTVNSASSAGTEHKIPTLSKSELIYNITYFDSAVFSNVSVSATGVLTYTITAGSTITVPTFMNIVFEVK